MSLDSCEYHGRCPNSNQVAKPHLPTSGHPAIEFPNGFTAVANFLDGLHMSTNLPANFLGGLDRTTILPANFLDYWPSCHRNQSEPYMDFNWIPGLLANLYQTTCRFLCVQTRLPANFLDGLDRSTKLPANFLDGLDRTARLPANFLEYWPSCGRNQSEPYMDFNWIPCLLANLYQTTCRFLCVQTRLHASFLDCLDRSTTLHANFLDGLDRTLACMAKPYMQLSCNAAIELHISFTDVMVRMRV